MNAIQVLDCTLRDGGYCNRWQFGFENIKKIISGLIEADVEIIECGFLTNKVVYDFNSTQFNTIEQITEVIPLDRHGKIIVAMVNYGEYEVEDLPEFDGTSIDGIRVAFHKIDMNEALDFCKKIKAKGYRVFIQPMVSLCYTDEEFLSMIRKVNEFEPDAFYIVDSFGMMKRKNLIRLFYIVEHNLKKDIQIGFHSHNNMQLAYSNAQTLVDMKTKCNLIIDSSVYGMGRGAGNLNTELFIGFLNDNYDKNYKLKPLLNIIDEILNGFYQRNYWGYSLPNYISAVHNAHPNYAGYLDDKKTLTVENMNDIFSIMDEYKKFSYDKSYVEDLYNKYMAAGEVQEEHQAELKKMLSGKKVLLIAPGKSSIDQKDLIQKVAEEQDVVVISVNFEYSGTAVDYIFLSNLRRFKKLDSDKKKKCIVTSNILDDKFYFQIKYSDLLSSVESVRDNAGMMAIKFLINYNVAEIMLAGFDGYSYDEKENYADCQMAFITKKDVLDAMNEGMLSVLKEYKQRVKISFLTKPKHIVI